MVTTTEHEARSILSPATGYLADDYDFTLSPSVGCTFGCYYCYVPTLRYFSRHASTWGSALAVKSNAPDLLRRDGEAGRIEGKRIYCSPTTDPYAGGSQERAIMRRLLEVFVEFPPELLVLQTRSPHVTRDVDLLRQLGERVVVGMSITTDNDDVRVLFEPRCARISRRVTAMDVLHATGIRTQASLAPLLPCDPDALADLVDPHCDWVVAQALKRGGPGARTWGPAREILSDHGWDDWLAGGVSVERAMATLRERFGTRYHEAQEGFGLRWL